MAQAFPYCQTAHLLLAKAAHDQGTMLAGQRLRRAATYAADRTLLRCLIEQAEPAAEAATIEAPTGTPEVVTIVPGEAEAPNPLDVSATPTLPVATDPATAAAPPVAEEPASASPPAPADTTLTPAAPAEGSPGPVKPATNLLAEAQGDAPVAEGLHSTTGDAPVLFDKEGAVIPVVAALPELFVATLPAAEEDAEEYLPAQAPSIRPPVEVGEARFEFGLAETPPPAVFTYELPGLVDEWAASAVTRTLGTPELLSVPQPAAPAAVTQAAAFTPAAFTGDATLGYALGESSRLGFSMQLLNMLLAEIEPAAAQPPAAALPPTGTFFEPDPLLLDYWATHCPPAPPQPSSLDLINNFLRRQPRLTRPAMLPPVPSAQADLSVRSTRAEPDLASESLARILVRQGKTARAIEIYEKLMVKQPEKMAYFAAQIHQLQPPA
ncbi:MAG: hypothetical protein NVSMB30_02000 [Hymenobacter sp.]